jgi:hypothetical protein
MRKVVGTLALVVACIASSQAQSVFVRETLLAKARELYGYETPDKVTFITVPAQKGGGQWSQPIDPGGPDKTRYNVTGDTATGTVLQEEGDQAYVDASPCNLRVMVFTKPYTKTLTSTTTCGGKQVTRYRFVQE